MIKSKVINIKQNIPLFEKLKNLKAPPFPKFNVNQTCI